MAMVKVMAVKKGFYGGVRVPVGHVFDVPEEAVGRWMEVISKPKAKPKAKPKTEDGGE